MAAQSVPPPSVGHVWIAAICCTADEAQLWCLGDPPHTRQ